jgi:hypothetical protein
VTIPAKYDELLPFDGDCTVGREGQYWSVLNQKGEIILKQKCQRMSLIEDQYVIVADTVGRHGLLNLAGDVLIEPIYSNIELMLNEGVEPLFRLGMDTQAIFIPDMRVRSSMPENEEVYMGYYQYTNLKGEFLSEEKEGYERRVGLGVYNLSFSPRQFTDLYSFHNFWKDHHSRHLYYLLVPKYPAPKYEIRNFYKGKAIIKKKNKYALVDLAGTILKGFSKQPPSWN